MPGFYSEGEYDLAGFCVGSVSKEKLITGSNIKAGDVLIGLGSSGVHSNGFSLVRAIINIKEDTLNQYMDALDRTIGEELLTPTKIYVKTILGLIEQFDIKGIAHITGGGFYENIPRIFPEGIGGEIQLGSWDVPRIFDILQSEGAVAQKDMFSTFNMGIGMVLAVDENISKQVVSAARTLGEKPFIIGKDYRRKRCRTLRIERLVVMVSGGGTNLQALIGRMRRRHYTGADCRSYIQQKRCLCSPACR